MLLCISNGVLSILIAKLFSNIHSACNTLPDIRRALVLINENIHHTTPGSGLVL